MVQIFGTAKSPGTMKALRFFKERGLKPQFVDLQRRAMAPGEIARFVQKFGLSALIDTGSKSYERAGLAYLRLSDEALIQRLLDEPQLMVQPLLRLGPTLAIGWDEAVWRNWYQHQRRVG
jgi:arsenate reductase-like glutaredoxin family protein